MKRPTASRTTSTRSASTTPITSGPHGGARVSPTIANSSVRTNEIVRACPPRAACTAVPAIDLPASSTRPNIRATPPALPSTAPNTSTDSGPEPPAASESTCSTTITASVNP